MDFFVLLLLLFILVDLCLLRFEHCKPTQNEELSDAQMLPPSSAQLHGPSDPEPSGPPPPPVPGAQDWVNAAEFVPGQPYCGRGEWPTSVLGCGRRNPRFLLTLLSMCVCVCVQLNR